MTELEEMSKEPDPTMLEKIGHSDDFSELEKGYQALADLGSIFSMVNLAHLYEHRPEQYGGVNLELAEHWYNSAVTAGSAVATYFCGRFYIRQRNYAKARLILGLGLERDYAPSITRLAAMYIDGRGTEKDYSKATTLLERASRLGNLSAKTALANMYINLGSNPLIILKGHFLKAYSNIKFEIEKRHRPDSELLKK